MFWMSDSIAIYSVISIVNFRQMRLSLPTKCLSVFDHFVGLALKRLKVNAKDTRAASIQR